MYTIFKKIFWILFRWLPGFNLIFDTRFTLNPIRVNHLLRKAFGNGRGVYWPIHKTSTIFNPKNIYVGVDTSPGYSPGCYIQGGGKIYIDDYTQIGPNVGIISSNHDPYNIHSHIPLEVKIGKYCWLGMNSVILPGVILGDFTIVGAGSIVTKSFLNGHCIIAGNPAIIIKDLNPMHFNIIKNKVEYNGFIKHIDFDEFCINNLAIDLNWRNV